MSDEVHRDPVAAKRSQENPSWTIFSSPWPQVRAALDREPRLILPVGTLVQHGPHLPLGTNTIIAEALAGELSKRLKILLAPTFHFGVRGPQNESYPGSAGLERKTLHRALNELLSEWEGHGVQEFILVTAHRHEPHLDALLMAMPSNASTTLIDLYAIEVEDLLDSSPRSEHAGELETSLMLHLAPDLVRTELAVDFFPDAKTYRKYARGRVATPPPGSQGILGAPSRATPEKGEAVFLRYIKSAQEILKGPEEGI